MNSALYVGQVRHRRFTPTPHQFAYKLFMLSIDLDEMDSVFDRFWFWSVNKPNLASFYRRDHLGNKNDNLKQAVYQLVKERNGISLSGPVRLLTNMAYFGYRMNPVSFYYCYDDKGETVVAIVAEVNNTPWGEQHCYVLTDNKNQHGSGVKKYHSKKAFHVSPFMGMDMEYDWRLSDPADHLSVHIQNFVHKDKRGSEKLFDATLTLQRQKITSYSLARVLLQFPFMTLKIVSLIYFEAIRLWFKKVPIHDHPDKKETPATVENKL